MGPIATRMMRPYRQNAFMASSVFMELENDEGLRSFYQYDEFGRRPSGRSDPRKVFAATLTWMFYSRISNDALDLPFYLQMANAALSTTPILFSGLGVVKQRDNVDAYEDRLNFPITREKYDAIKRYLEMRMEKKGYYNMLHNNCAHFASAVGRRFGLDVPKSLLRVINHPDWLASAIIRRYANGSNRGEALPLIKRFTDPRYSVD